MIDLTPLEVRKKTGDFRRIMRGYDPATVDDFIELVADRLEELVHENATLREQLRQHAQQVTEYRERERALTDALVTAQEMREEVRRQALQEAEESKQATEAETSQLRRTVEQEAQELRRAAEEEATRLRTSAEEEAARLRSSAQQQAAQALSEIQNERQRTEDALRRMQSRQREFMENYRALLERELEDLDEIARSLGHGRAGSDDVAVTPAASAGAIGLGTAGHAGGREPDEEDVGAFDAGPVDDEFDSGSEAPFEPFEPEPFEPEPYVDDVDEADTRDTLELEQEAEAVVAGLEPTTDGLDPVDVAAGDELDLYSGVAAPADEDGVPGAVGLDGISLVAEGEAVDVFRRDEADEAAEGEEAEVDPDALLRNAAAAGYSLPEEDELLLSDAIEPEADETPDPAQDTTDAAPGELETDPARAGEEDADWLGGLLEDEER